VTAAQAIEQAEPADAAVPPSAATRAGANALMRTTIAARFKQGRELNGWDQREAASRMGYENGTQLSLIEAGKRNTPLAVFCVASEVYGVSVDFLLGLSSEPERDPSVAERQAALRHVESVLREHASAIAEAVNANMQAASKPVALARRVLGVAAAAVEAFRRFSAINEDAWQDMRGGAPLLKAMHDLEDAASAAMGVLTKQERMEAFAASRPTAPAHRIVSISPTLRPKNSAFDS